MRGGKHSDRECLGNKLKLSSATPWRVGSHDDSQICRGSCHVEVFVFLRINEIETCGSVSSFEVIEGFGKFFQFLFLRKLEQYNVIMLHRAYKISCVIFNIYLFITKKNTYSEMTMN